MLLVHDGSFSIFISLYMAKSSVHTKTHYQLFSLPFGVIAGQKGEKYFQSNYQWSPHTKKHKLKIPRVERQTNGDISNTRKHKTRIKQRNFLIIIVVSAFVGFSPSRGYLWALSAVHAAQHNCRTHNLFKTMRWSLAYADENLFSSFVFSWCFRRTSPNNSIRFLSKTC